MRPCIVSQMGEETLIEEGCFIIEVWNTGDDPALSIARARVAAHTETAWHYLDVDERYLITQGRGVMELEGLPPTKVESGDVVVVPAGRGQRIRNPAAQDLVFYCLCTPRFETPVYHPQDSSG